MAVYDRFHSSVFVGPYLFAICTLSLVGIVSLSYRARNTVLISAAAFRPDRV